MLIKFLAAFSLISLLACQGKSSSKKTEHDTETANSESFLLKSFVDDFLSNDKVKSDIVTLQCFKNNDSLQFTIIDAYPDPDEVPFFGYLLVKNHKVCAVGDSIPAGFIKIDFKNVPDEVIKQSNEIKNSKELVLYHSEPKVESICFKGKSVIECRQVYHPTVTNKEGDR